MPLKHHPQAKVEEMKSRIVARVRELLDFHEERYLEYMNASESPRIGITFPVVVDFSESIAHVETKIRYSQVVSDKRTDDIDPPEQVGLFNRDNEPTPEAAQNGNGEGGQQVGQELTVAETMERNKKRQRAKDVADHGD